MRTEMRVLQGGVKGPVSRKCPFQGVREAFPIDKAANNEGVQVEAELLCTKVSKPKRVENFELQPAG